MNNGQNMNLYNVLDDMDAFTGFRFQGYRVSVTSNISYSSSLNCYEVVSQGRKPAVGVGFYCDRAKYHHLKNEMLIIFDL